MIHSRLPGTARIEILAALDSGLFERPALALTDVDCIKIEILDFAHALLRGQMPAAALDVNEVKLHPGDPCGDWARLAEHVLNGAWETAVAYEAGPDSAANGCD